MTHEHTIYCFMTKQSKSVQKFAARWVCYLHPGCKDSQQFAVLHRGTIKLILATEPWSIWFIDKYSQYGIVYYTSQPINILMNEWRALNYLTIHFPCYYLCI